MQNSIKDQTITNQNTISNAGYEWKSDENVLKAYVRQNLRLGPKAIKANMQAIRQSFSLKAIKETRKDIIDEVFPKDRKIAFHPSNCLAINAEDNYDDNLFKLYLQFPSMTSKKSLPKEVLRPMNMSFSQQPLYCIK